MLKRRWGEEGFEEGPMGPHMTERTPTLPEKRGFTKEGGEERKMKGDNHRGKNGDEIRNNAEVHIVCRCLPLPPVDASAIHRTGRIEPTLTLFPVWTLPDACTSGLLLHPRVHNARVRKID